MEKNTEEKKEDVEQKKRGRPVKFKTVEELEEKIENYFKSCYEEKWVDEEQRNEETGELVRDKAGRRVLKPVRKNVQIEPFTITGLALFLETTRETLMDYQEKDIFSDTIKKAKVIIENAYEKRLIKRGNGGDIFALKNFNWKDHSSVELDKKEDYADIREMFNNLKKENKEEDKEDVKAEDTKNK